MRVVILGRVDEHPPRPLTVSEADTPSELNRTVASALREIADRFDRAAQLIEAGSVTSFEGFEEIGRLREEGEGDGG